MAFVRIGEASKASGVSERMVRHYEKLGMMPEPARRASNYRIYTNIDVERLRFIAQARSLGIPLEAIAELLDADEPVRPLLVQDWIVLLDTKAADLEDLRLQVGEMAKDTPFGASS